MNYLLPSGYQVLIGMTQDSYESMHKLSGDIEFSCLATFAEIPKEGQLVILNNKNRKNRVFRVDSVILKNVEKEGYIGDALGTDWTTFYPDQVSWAYLEVSYVREISFNV